MFVKVFETGSAKWVTVETGGVILYTSDEPKATIFDMRFLTDTNAASEDFLVYRRTLRAVPVGTNRTIHECDTVNTFLKEMKDR